MDNPGLASPPSPYDEPTPCPECGIGDAEYSEHEADCPSGYPTQDRELDELQKATREFEDDTMDALEARRSTLTERSAVIASWPDDDSRYWVLHPMAERRWSEYGRAVWRAAFDAMDAAGLAHETDPDWEYDRYALPEDDRERTAYELRDDIMAGIATATRERMGS
jgi:hypothetical protein